MTAIKPTRRAMILSAAMVTAWTVDPARALLLQAKPGKAAQRIEDLLRRMTLEEKAGQLTLMAAAWAGGAAVTLNPAGATTSFDAQLAEARGGRLTGVFNGAGSVMAQQMQRVAVGESRLQIPLIFAADILHGFRTVFPVPLAEAASFDPELAQRTARAAATEAAAAGIDWTFAPMLDIARDQRWGRGVEGAGEDVLLGRVMAAARVRGFQGEHGLASRDAVAACAKHLVAYGAVESGLDYRSVDISERTLREVYFPPFQAAIDAGVATVMPSFNELSGIPATANRWLLTDVLRKEWGFGGVVVSDYTADEELIAHGIAPDAREATKIAFNAGVDISMQSGLFLKHLPQLARDGEISLDRLNQAVRRVLTLKADLGLFDDPFLRIDPAREKRVVRVRETLDLAREAGRRSIVLLKNEGRLLPLPRSDKRIALIGPFVGKHDLIGPWNVYGTDADAVGLEAAVRAAVADPALVSATPGAGIEAPIPGGIAAAVAAARAADIVVLAIGEAQTMSGEAQSRTEIVVPAAQMALAEAVAAVGKPVVVLLRTGRALALDGAVANAAAILVTWFLGSQDGPAIADILFGAHGPSARLPVSFPRRSGQQPYYYAHKRTGRPNGPGPLEPYKTHFSGIPDTALFPFGHGLTYGDVHYAALDLGDAIVTRATPLRVKVRLANRGAIAAEEVVQLYVQDVAASVTRPIRELKAFRRIRLLPGEEATAEFSLASDDLTMLDPNLKPTVEPGLFRIWAAPSAEADGVTGSFTLR